MKGYQAGQFNRKVTIEQLDTTQSALGSPAITWNLFATWWCKFAPLTGSESFSSQQVEAKADYKLEGPFISGVTAKMRINDHGVFYDISSPPLVYEDRSTFYMTILAKLGLNNG